MSLLELRGLGKRFGGLTAVTGLDLASSPAKSWASSAPTAREDHRVPPGGRLSPSHHGNHPLQGCVDRGPQAARHLPRAASARTFQLVQPFAGLTAVENVMVGAFNRERDTAAARRHARRSSTSSGWRQAVRSRRELTLSDRKRLEMARGLATRPDLLLLDEVMSGLNPTEIEAMVG
jgi:branched-chain amino acid transport system ATP-binding protein